MSERGKKEKPTEKKERMKNIFKKLHIGSSHEPHRSNEIPPPVPSPSDAAEHLQTSGGSTVTPSTSSPSTAPITPASASGGLSAVVNRQDFFSSEEEFQVQLALAISASNSDFRGDDPEKDQIHAATLLSLGGHRIDSNKDDVAETLSRQYWVSFDEFSNDAMLVFFLISWNELGRVNFRGLCCVIFVLVFFITLVNQFL